MWKLILTEVYVSAEFMEKVLLLRGDFEMAMHHFFGPVNCHISFQVYKVGEDQFTLLGEPGLGCLSTTLEVSAKACLKLLGGLVSCLLQSDVPA